MSKKCSIWVDGDKNSAIMSVLNKLTVQKLKEEVQEVEPEPTGFMKGLFKRK
ncbi:hypothetical protein WDR10_10235 [Kurthia gibsonii]|uniref:hypothetical protein n=1 Tax=Kurthia gibsonii TaxID=33946 RepID=UPI0030CF020B